MYDILLKKIHNAKASSVPAVAPPPQNIATDGNDVFYFFGGAVLADMLYLRYVSIKTCQASRRDVISQDYNFTSN